MDKPKQITDPDNNIHYLSALASPMLSSLMAMCQLTRALHHPPCDSVQVPYAELAAVSLLSVTDSDVP